MSSEESTAKKRTAPPPNHPAKKRAPRSVVFAKKKKIESCLCSTTRLISPKTSASKPQQQLESITMDSIVRTSMASDFLGRSGKKMLRSMLEEVVVGSTRTREVAANLFLKKSKVRMLPDKPLPTLTKSATSPANRTTMMASTV